MIEISDHLKIKIRIFGTIRVEFPKRILTQSFRNLKISIVNLKTST
jgi:hypothetical protein